MEKGMEKFSYIALNGLRNHILVLLTIIEPDTKMDYILQAALYLTEEILCEPYQKNLLSKKRG